MLDGVVVIVLSFKRPIPSMNKFRERKKKFWSTMPERIRGDQINSENPLERRLYRPDQKILNVLLKKWTSSNSTQFILR